VKVTLFLVPSPLGEGFLRSRADEGEPLTLGMFPHPTSFGVHLLPRDKEERNP
jgi:hypothetical protein